MFHRLGYAKILRCFPWSQIYFFASIDFFYTKLIVLSSLQDVCTMLLILDSFSASLCLRGMILEMATSFMADLTLFTNSIVFLVINPRHCSIFRLFPLQYNYISLSVPINGRYSLIWPQKWRKDYIVLDPS